MRLTKEEFQNCMDQFLLLGEPALYMNHYQLAEETHITSPMTWKNFLTEPTVVDYINTEMSIIRTAAINHIVQKAPNSNSVGQAQLINALQKIDEDSKHKDGPAFIYCYVPLNDEQKYAPNVQEVNSKGENIEDEWQRKPKSEEEFEFKNLSEI